MRKRSRRNCAIETLEARALLSTVYVDAGASGATHDGSSWANAFLDLQPALQAATSGTEIRVAEGTYKPGTLRTSAFLLKTGVSILGGYAGDGAADPNARDVTFYQTTLSGDIGTIGDNTDNVYHVVSGTGINSTAVLDGFTITRGNANASSQTFGGGMYISSGSPKIGHCTFTANSAADWGGGMYSVSSSAPTISD